MIRGILVDMDGLMFDTEAIGYRGWKEAGRRLGIRIDDEAIAALRGLGDREKQMHYEVGVHAAEAGIDVLVCIGALSTETARGAREASSGAMDVRHYPSKAKFFEEMSEVLKEGDTILVKASHGMEFPEIVERLQK